MGRLGYNGQVRRSRAQAELRKSLRWLVVIMAALSSSCWHDDQGDARRRLKIRVLTNNPSADLARDTSRGLALIASELGADVAELQRSEEVQRRSLLRELGDQGTDLVFCFGDVYEAAVFTEARAYPGTSFVIRPGSPSGRNVASISFLVEEPAFLGGVLAELIRQSKQQVGVIAGCSGSWIERAEEGFLAGMRSQGGIDELIRAEGADGPWALAAQGVAVALYACDSADPAVLAAAHDAGLQLIVTDARALRLDSDVVLASITIDLGEAMLRIAREVADGTFESQEYAFDLGSGVLDLKLSPAIDQVTARALQQVLASSRDAITAGWVEVEQLGI
jgi:basic membrane lipoprotein Med (substrate-binding protein (PBP1-ABC) superfamily)